MSSLCFQAGALVGGLIAVAVLQPGCTYPTSPPLADGVNSSAPGSCAGSRSLTRVQDQHRDVQGRALQT
jgi:hypothetical protein